ncbi:MAG: helix-turn-helix domain-containing protein [Oscillospiraceae bacterium]|nr:helix-turn-helix domain-containing protein [Oscillospiraceae bacterium]
MENLYYLRKTRGVSLKELASVLGVSESSVSLYENKKREASYDILKKTASFFGVSIDFLLGHSTVVGSENTVTVSVPVIEEIEICNGEAKCFYSYSKNECLENGKSYFYLNISQNDMEISAEKGDLALFEKTKDIKSGDIIAFIKADYPVSIAKYLENGDTSFLLYLKSKDAEVIEGIQDFEILGKLLSVTKKY